LRSSDLALSSFLVPDRHAVEGDTMTMTLFRTLTLMLGAIGCAVATAAWAGGYVGREGVAMRGHGPGACLKEGRPRAGLAEQRFEHGGPACLFAPKAHRDAVAAEPDRYAPRYGGCCAFGMAGGFRAAIDPAAFAVRDGLLDLNPNRDVLQPWSAGVPGFVASADRHGPAVSNQTQVIDD
jgi:hypothetical protein